MFKQEQVSTGNNLAIKSDEQIKKEAVKLKNKISVFEEITNTLKNKISEAMMYNRPNKQLPHIMQFQFPNAVNSSNFLDGITAVGFGAEHMDRLVSKNSLMYKGFDHFAYYSGVSSNKVFMFASFLSASDSSAQTRIGKVSSALVRVYLNQKLNINIGMLELLKKQLPVYEIKGINICEPWAGNGIDYISDQVGKALDMAWWASKPLINYGKLYLIHQSLGGEEAIQQSIKIGSMMKNRHFNNQALYYRYLMYRYRKPLLFSNTYNVVTFDLLENNMRFMFVNPCSPLDFYLFNH